VQESNQTFFELIEELKAHNVPMSAAAEAAGMSSSAIRNWKSRGSGAKLKHITMLIEAFPIQLVVKAQQLGIETPSLTDRLGGKSISELAAMDREDLLLAIMQLQRRLSDLEGKR